MLTMSSYNTLNHNCYRFVIIYNTLNHNCYSFVILTMSRYNTLNHNCCRLVLYGMSLFMVKIFGRVSEFLGNTSRVKDCQSIYLVSRSECVPCSIPYSSWDCLSWDRRQLTRQFHLCCHHMVGLPRSTIQPDLGKKITKQEHTFHSHHIGTFFFNELC